jgi:hypothetical protein
MPAYPNAWNNNLNFTEDHLIQTPTYTGTMRLYEWNETTLTYDYKYTADSHMAEYPSGVGLFDKKYKVVVCVKIFVPET